MRSWPQPGDGEGEESPRQEKLEEGETGKGLACSRK